MRRVTGDPSAIVGVEEEVEGGEDEEEQQGEEEVMSA
jgi:hypothetical protein